MLRNFLVATALGGLALSGAATAVNAASDDAKFIAGQSANQWVFSKFKGSSVLGPNNEHIGSVNDLLFDQSGQIVGIIVGVGGFLGIGQKNVAIDMSAFQAVSAATGTPATQAPNTTPSNDRTEVSLKVSWTKDELRAAPDFQYYKPPEATTGTGPTNGQGGSPRGPR